MKEYDKKEARRGKPKKLQYLSPVSSALFALPSSALLVQPLVFSWGIDLTECVTIRSKQFYV